MKRRRFLALLGFGGVAGGYVVATDSERAAEQLSPLDAPFPERSLGAIDRSAVRTRGSTAPFSFVSKSFSEPVTGDSTIERVMAKPASNRTGDRIRLSVSTNSDLRELAEQIRVGLNVGTDERVRTTVGEREVTFEGGPTERLAALVGILDKSSPAILVVRGTSVDSAKELATEWELD